MGSLMQLHSPGRSALVRAYMGLLGLELHVILHLQGGETRLLHMLAAALQGKLQCSSTYQISTCISFAFVPLAKASNIYKPEWLWEGAELGVMIQWRSFMKKSTTAANSIVTYSSSNPPNTWILLLFNKVSFLSAPYLISLRAKLPFMGVLTSY